MQEQTSDTTVQQPQQVASSVSNIAPPKRKRVGKKGKFLKIFLVLIVILGIFGGGAWYLLREPQVNQDVDGEDQELTTPEFQEPTETPTPAAEPINKEEIRFQVLNGTGVPKEAGFLQEKLERLGYSEIEVANADEQDYVRTEVTFSKSLSETIIDEINEELEDIYANVRSSTSSSLDDFDIVIITGYKIGFTPAPTEAPSTPTPTTEAAGTVTPTTTPTESPTPTPN